MKHTDATAQVVWVRPTQMSADDAVQQMNDEKRNLMTDSNFSKQTSNLDDVERFGEAALEAVQHFLDDNKVVDQFVDNIVYCRKTIPPKFAIAVLGNQLCVTSNAGRESFAR